MIYTTYHHPVRGTSMGNTLTPRVMKVNLPAEPSYVLPEDRARLAMQIVCTMRAEGYTDEQITRTLRQQVGGITDSEISVALATAPCQRSQPGLPEIQTAPGPDEGMLEPPELPFDDDEPITFDVDEEPDYAAELLPPPATPRSWWSKWWWAAALGVVAVGGGGYLLLKKK